MLEVIKFSAPWCVSCKAYASVFESFKKLLKEDVRVREMDIEELTPEQMMRYKVLTLPTTAFIEDGEVVDRVTGVAQEQELVEKHPNFIKWPHVLHR